ncbi:hypothetical protein DSECCO2_543940 [anaerobic digester metagenome]
MMPHRAASQTTGRQPYFSSSRSLAASLRDRSGLTVTTSVCMISVMGMPASISSWVSRSMPASSEMVAARMSRWVSRPAKRPASSTMGMWRMRARFMRSLAALRLSCWLRVKTSLVMIFFTWNMAYSFFPILRRFDRPAQEKGLQRGFHGPCGEARVDLVGEIWFASSV